MFYHKEKDPLPLVILLLSDTFHGYFWHILPQSEIICRTVLFFKPLFGLSQWTGKEALRGSET